jgi:phosphatidylinositol kinase/protein kinase (PI-3  family)
MQRDKFPERIPFRLTRMLINAMEVSGIEGNFRITCENVMRVLRDNKDSLMAVLEAFVHDPLINWRLLTQHTNGPSPLQGSHLNSLLSLFLITNSAISISFITILKKLFTQQPS